MKNEYEIKGDVVIMHITQRDGRKHEVLFDFDDLKLLKKLNLKWGVSYKKKIRDYYCTTSRYLGIINGKPSYESLALHRVVTNAQKGDKVDHCNHKTLDNRKCNLKVTNNQKNSTNRKGKNSNNTSGERNVSWSKSEQKWLVQLQVNGKNTCFGKFKYEDLDKAVTLARQKRKEIYDKIINT